jgi:5'-nucleotidase
MAEFSIETKRAMNRREFITKSIIAGSAIGLAPTLLGSKERDFQLVILHTNDMHSRIDPLPDDGRKWGGMGGMAQRAALINSIRSEGHPVLLLDSGDIFQGTPYFNYYGGELEFKLMSLMGYDAATLGNHDFDNGLEGFNKQLPHATFPFVSSNYDFSSTLLSGKVREQLIIQKGPVKVGIFGLGIELEGLVGASLFGSTKYLDPIAVAKQRVADLRLAGCHMIICLSHLGLEYSSDKISDVRLAKEISGIDLILGGHTHTFMPKPYIINGPENWSTLIHQVGWSGIILGRLDFIFSRNLKKTLVLSTSVEVSEKSISG